MHPINSSPLKSGPFGHQELVDRIKRSLYYGKNRRADEVMIRPSLPLTEATVELFDRAFRDKQPSYHPVSSSTDKSSDAIKTEDLESLDMHYAVKLSSRRGLSPCSLVLAIIYLERLQKRNRKYLQNASPCDLFLISMLISSKYLFDDGSEDDMLNEEWAELASVSLQSLNKLEIDFLMALDWNVHVTPAQFYNKLKLIETLVTWKQIQRRHGQGCTYQELLSLGHSLDWRAISSSALKMVALTFVTYSLVLTSVLATSILLGSIISTENDHTLDAKSLSYSQANFANRTNLEKADSLLSRELMLQTTFYANRYRKNFGSDSFIRSANDQQIITEPRKYPECQLAAAGRIDCDPAIYVKHLRNKIRQSNAASAACRSPHHFHNLPLANCVAAI